MPRNFCTVNSEFSTSMSILWPPDRLKLRRPDMVVILLPSVTALKYSGLR